MFKKVDAFYAKITLMMTMCLMAIGMVLPLGAFAGTWDGSITSTDLNSTGALGMNAGTDTAAGSVDWPWTRFLNSLAQEVTGPLPMVIGILAVCGAGFSLLFGNGGAGTQKALTLICVVGVVLFTPTLVTYIYRSATGATIDMVIGTVNAIAVAPPPLP